MNDAEIADIFQIKTVQQSVRREELRTAKTSLSDRWRSLQHTLKLDEFYR